MQVTSEETAAKAPEHAADQTGAGEAGQARIASDAKPEATPAAEAKTEQAAPAAEQTMPAAEQAEPAAVQEAKTEQAAPAVEQAAHSRACSGNAYA